MAKTDVPELDAHLVRYGPTKDSSRIFIVVEEVALWLSLVRDWSAPEDKRVIGAIRDTMLQVVSEGQRANWVWDAG